uniref:Chorion peroxidase n=1 Tax=Strigamia maritima TaxID=126957 RepID=T1IPA1_STRMM
MLSVLYWIIFFLSYCNGQPSAVFNDQGPFGPKTIEEYYSTLNPLPPPDHYQCPLQQVCVQRAQCFYIYSLGINIEPSDTCELENEELGICCPLNTGPGSDVVPYADDDKHEESKNQFAQNYLDAIERVIRHILMNQYHIPDLLFTIRLKFNYGLEQSASLYRILWNQSLNATCNPPPRCYHSPYRSVDGTCNNIKHPNWGSANSAFNRRISPRYSDGMNLPRVSIDGHSLPIPRHVSLTLSSPEQKPQYSLSQMVTPFGQFISHDIAATPSETEDNPRLEGVNCCHDYRHSYCIPLSVPEGDFNFQFKNVSCLNMIRSKSSKPENCQISVHREQLNEATSFIDGSAIYGSAEDIEHQIRSFKDGLLKISSLHKHQYLPLSNLSSRCGNRRKGIHCFLAGDGRSNQNPGITCMHTIWLREHNVVAKTLSRLNPHWEDETVFQETRKIVIAEIQHITYNEYLPLILDLTTRKKHDILLKPTGYSYNYLPHLKPNIMNEFASAAYRMGHSIVQDNIPLLRNDHYVGSIKLEDSFFNPELFYEKYNLEMVVEGLISDSAQVVDRNFAPGLTQSLFKSDVRHHKGTDLLSINIQRGRDHGIAGYNEWRQLCGLKYALNFDDFRDVISSENVDYLSKIYRFVDDVDLYVAGVMEQHIVGGVLGPTFSCIIADQFRRLKQSDRFWYERFSEKEMVGFSPEQLQEIRKVTLAGILCENTHISLVQPLVFVKPGPNNLKKPCSSEHIPEKNLLPWLHRVVNFKRFIQFYYIGMNLR